MRKPAAALATTFLAAWMPAADAGLLGNLVSKGTGATASGGREKKTYDANTLSPGQLKSCVLQAYSIDNTAAVLKKQRDLLDSHQKVVLATRRKYDATVNLYKLGQGSKPDIGPVRAEEEKYNKRVDTFNAGITRIKFDEEAFRKACAGKRYFDSDLTALGPELPADVSKVLSASR